MPGAIDRILPRALRSADAGTYRHAVLVTSAVAVSTSTILLTLLLLCGLGFETTAMNAAWLLPLQPLPLLVLWVTSRPAIAGHLFMTLLMGAIAWDFGPDDGLGVMAVIALSVAGWVLVGVRGGMIWTGIAVMWAALLGPFVFRPDDYSPALSLTTAMIALVSGVAAGINETTRIKALHAAHSALQALQEQRDSMRTFVEGAFSAWVETEGGELIQISDGAADLVGKRANTLLGRRLRELVHPDDVGAAERQFRKSGRRGFVTELRIRDVEGNWIWVEVFGVPLDIGNRAPERPRWIFGVRDIAEERRSRERLIRAQKLESVGQLAAGIAHDFNNLLTVINGFAEMLPAGESRTHILRAGRDAARLTADIMAFARGSPSGAAWVDLPTQLRKWQPVFQSLLGGRTRLVLDLPSAAPVSITEGQLNQVLLNLVSNARDALPDGGEVAVRVFDEVEARACCAARELPVDEHVCFVVRDNGVGMSDEVLERAFDPFFTTKSASQGTGLGLASVYGIVHQQGGLVEISSRKGAGTEVLVILRRQLDTRVQPARNSGDPDLPVGAANVLVLEDNAAVSELVAEALRKSGYHVHTCRSVSEARARFATVSCELLIADMVLVGELGTDFVLEVRRSRPALPVLLISGYADADTRRSRALVSDPSRFLAKPFAVEALLREVRYLLPEPSVETMIRNAGAAITGSEPTTGLHPAPKP